jgi:tetratricopeptide (TPR) repeat protein
MVTMFNPPADVSAALAQARELLDSNPARAAERSRQVLASSPHNADAYRLLGAALRRLGQDPAANDAELAAIEASGNDPELAAAGEAMLKQDYMSAEQILRGILQRRPEDVAAMRMLGEIAANFGALRDAERLFRQALQLAPGFEYARLHLADTLNQQNRSGEALAEVDRITGELRDFEETRNLRASMLGRVGNYEGSAELYEQSAAEAPDNPKLLISLGYAEQTLGRQDEAVATYRRAIKIRSTFGEAWFSLANLKTLRFTDEEIATMEAGLDAPLLEVEDRLHLHFALGKAFEDHGEDERAFQHYRQGNALRAAQLRNNPAQLTAVVEESERVFTPELMSSRGGAGHEARDPIFIVGMPRAGSTLIEQILASHPQVEGTAELPDIINLARSLEPDERDFAQGVWRRYPRIIAELPESKLKELGELYVERTRAYRKTDRPHFTDKMPNNWIHVGLIRLILPNAKIVDARRHPLACGFSNFKQHFARGQEFSYNLEHFGHYYRDYVRLMRHFDAVAPSVIHRVIHEQLIADPETQIRQLLNYVGLPFNEACLRFYETERPIRTASSEQVRRPISAEGTEQWRRFEQWLDPLKTALGPALEDWAA